ncbi:unnamed protein product [Caenorhabditis bovis]|uniref:Trafficking protein particle complex subunit n=1 Tax=Caenorhabditis bovis TaxID=2654633 RepID=A0A8S1EAA5_9PELO|nr:unnamed protein product [Caenorhabditis bovis]
MAKHIQHVFIISQAGSLIYDWSSDSGENEVVLTYEYPLNVFLERKYKKVMVVFGEKDGVKIGYYVKSVNDIPVFGTRFEVNGKSVDVLDYLEKKESFPVTLRYAAPTINANDKIHLSSTFYSLFTIAVQLSPTPKSSGIEILETSQFKLFCLQTRTGVKFIVVTSAASSIPADSLLTKMYEIYADFALKNPFYSIDMPIRSHKFEEELSALLEKAERSNGAIMF